MSAPHLDSHSSLWRLKAPVIYQKTESHCSGALLHSEAAAEGFQVRANQSETSPRCHVGADDVRRKVLELMLLLLGGR